jgi:hypothetical protein
MRDADFVKYRRLHSQTTNSIIRALIEKLTVALVLKKLPFIHGPGQFIDVFTKARHWSLS